MTSLRGDQTTFGSRRAACWVTSSAEAMSSPRSGQVGRGDLDGSPPDPLGFESARKDTGGRRGRHPHLSAEHERRCGCLDVEQIELRMASRKLRHRRHSRARIRQPDVFSQLEKAEDRSLLLCEPNPLKGSRKVAAAAGDRCTASAVVPIRSRVDARTPASPIEAGKEFLDQQAVVEQHRSRARHLRLQVCEVGIVDRGKAGVVPLRQDPLELAPSGGHATRDNERRAAQVDESNFAALVDSPTVAQFCGQARLAPMRHLCVASSGHTCIVARG